MSYHAFKKNKLYLGNKMVGIRQFNFPWFDASANTLRLFPAVDEVFNPAERDRETGFYPDPDCMGTIEDMEKLHFSRRDALGTDWAWIAAYSDAMIVGPLWHMSTGTISEIACHQALGLPVWQYVDFVQNWDKPCLYDLKLPSIMELGGTQWTTRKSGATALPVTAVAERPDKFTYDLQPKSGADIWLKAPEDEHGRRRCADLHLNVDWAEELAEVLLQAVEEARASNLNLGHG